MTVFLPPEFAADQFENEALDRLSETVRKSKILGLPGDVIRADALEEAWSPSLVDWYLAQVELFGPEFKIRVNRSSDGSPSRKGASPRSVESTAKTLVVIGFALNIWFEGVVQNGSVLGSLIGHPLGVILFVLAAAMFVRAMDRRSGNWVPRKVSRLGASLFLAGVSRMV